MSKLTDKLRRIAEGEHPRLGFGASTSKTKLGAFLLMAAVELDKANLIDQKVLGLVDSLLLQESSENATADFAAVVKEAGEVPCGLWTTSLPLAKSFQAAKGDFVVFPMTGTPVAVLRVDDLGRVVEINEELSDTLLRALDTIAIEALLLRSDVSKTAMADVRWLVEKQRVALVARKPVLLLTQDELESETLAALASTGVLGLVVPLRLPEDVAKLSRLRDTVMALPPVRKQETQHREPILPLSEIQRPFGR